MRSLVFSLALLLGAGAQAAEPLPKEVVVGGVEFVLVPAGWFWYSVENGDITELELDEPRYRQVKVWLDSYYIAKFEGRARDFERFMDARVTRFANQYAIGETEGCAVRRDASGDYYLVQPERDLPASNLSWNLANEFAQWMGFRLPTEAEWEKAARGTDRRAWPWGDDYPDDTHAGFAFGTACNPTPVDSFPKGVSPYGAWNMAGNVFEYVADWHNTDFDAALKDGARNPVPPSHGTTYRRDFPKPVKILKGGRWASTPQDMSIYMRDTMEPHLSFVCYGVRFALDVGTLRARLADGSAEVVLP